VAIQYWTSSGDDWPPSTLLWVHVDVKETTMNKNYVARALPFLAMLLALSHPAASFADSGPKPGTILTSEPMTLAASLGAVATGKRITYVSTEPSGNPIVVSGVVLTPRSQIRQSHPENATRTVAWAHGTTGVADQCAPSATDHLDLPAYDDYTHVVAGYVSQGWTVTATDYPGLGTPGPHPYVVGESEGRSVIDSVRAARNVNPTLSDKWVVSGHSQGGQAAMFASEQADTYGKGLQLRGTVALAPASNIDLIAPALVGTPVQGYLVMAIYGLAAVDPTVNPDEILAQPALDRVGVLESGCFDEVMAAFADLAADELLVGGQLPDAVAANFAASNPGKEAGNSPVLLVQGLNDDTIPADLTQYFHSQLCAFDQPVQLTEYAGFGHIDVLPASQDDVIDYITDRFKKEPAPNNC
jgi:pimeloyl-ACP methyl ester carboxylesterase